MPKFDKTWVFPCKLLRAVDGDTADLVVDLGMRQFTKDRFRLLGIDTPERGQKGYQEAKDYLQSYFGKDLQVVTTKVGKYGRWLAELYDTIDDESINQKIIDLRLGVVYGSSIPVSREESKET
jgi:micrococcal nuclease